MNWGVASTSSSVSSSSVTLKSIMAVTAKMNENKKALDASRDMAIESLRSQGFYASVVNDCRGEVWVLDDRVVDQIERQVEPSPYGNSELFPIYGVRIIRRSAS